MRVGESEGRVRGLKLVSLMTSRSNQAIFKWLEKVQKMKANLTSLFHLTTFDQEFEHIQE